MSTPTATIPLLVHGERLSRDEFERRYEQMPDVKAELLDGVVYIMSSPVSGFHGSLHYDLIGWLNIYTMHTPGCMGFDNTTLRLSAGSEPQPDVMLFVSEEYGGSTQLSAEGYPEGSPELIAEIAVSSIDYDLNIKLPIYRANGVQEYLVWRVEDEIINWLTLRNGSYEVLQPDSQGIIRSEVFPGLWLDPNSLIYRDPQRVMRISLQGVSSLEHANFVQLLQSRRTTR